MTAPISPYHYALIARAIDAIDANPALAQRLDDLATHLGISGAHLHRVFSRYAGISPKRYAQFLTLDHAKRLLAERHSQIAVADLAGLSGTGRLYDLFLRWEAMTPDQYAKGGAGLTISFGHFDSPFGPAVAMGTDRGLCGLAFGAEIGMDHAFADLARRWPKARLIDAPEAIAPWVKAAFAQTGTAQLHLMGGPFQIKVWQALLAIPSGHVASYGQIATAIAAPRAARAVGTAIGQNPISLLIPCHRALRQTGALGGYHWGLGIKRMMLAHEAAQSGIT